MTIPSARRLFFVPPLSFFNVFLISDTTYDS